MSAQIHGPGEGIRTIDIGSVAHTMSAFANGEPDPETAGQLLAQIDMEVLAPATQ